MDALAPQQGVLTLFGYGSVIHVDRGHLIVKDGNESSRFSRVRHGLKRLVVIGNTGTVSLAALR
jgi:hypothetical protein